MHRNNAGSITIPTVLPIQYLCGQIYLLTGEGRDTVLFSAKYSKFETVGLLGGDGTSEAALLEAQGAGDVDVAGGQAVGGDVHVAKSGVPAAGGRASSSSSGWGDVAPQTTGGKGEGKRTEAVVPGTAVSRRQAEEQAKGIR